MHEKHSTFNVPSTKHFVLFTNLLVGAKPRKFLYYARAFWLYIPRRIFQCKLSISAEKKINSHMLWHQSYVERFMLHHKCARIREPIQAFACSCAVSNKMDFVSLFWKVSIFSSIAMYIISYEVHHIISQELNRRSVKACCHVLHVK